MITNNPTNINRTEVLPGISDHDCCYTELYINPMKQKQKPRKIPLFNKADWENFRQQMREVNKTLQNCYEQNSANTLWCTFRDTIVKGAEMYIPSRMTKRRDGYPWITQTLKKLMRKRDRMYKNHKHTPKYKDLKRTIQQQLRSAYWNYVNEIVTSTDDGTQKPSYAKKFWTYMKHCRTDHTGVSPLRQNGILHSNPTAKAEILNQQFQSVFTDDQSPQETNLYNSTLPEMPDIEITETGVLKLLQNLKPYKAQGPDNIHPRILKELAVEITPSLTLIFRKSYETEEVPKDWLKANVSPIFKHGQKYLASNYRPISLTCIASKLMEHILVSNIMKHAQSHNILYDLQHGFRSRVSCETQLIQFTNDLVTNMQSGAQTDVIVMDFSKAFDKVSHTKLVDKLHHYGIQGKTNSWVKAFLTDRSQRVLIEGEASSEVLVTSGVPQGSVLGPCLFLFYINDIPDNITSTVRLFADDTIMYIALKPKINTAALQEDLNTLDKWTQKWKMSFNLEKCHVIPVTRNKTITKTQYILHGQPLQTVSQAKYLGLTITSDLRWNAHINSISSKANRSLGFLRRNLKVSSIQIKTLAYFTFVRPILENSCTVWDPYTATQINKLEMIQRRAVRYVLHRHHNTSSVTNMLQSLGWRSLADRRKDAKLCMLYKISNDLVGIPANKYLIPSNTVTRKQHSLSYVIPHSRCNYHLYSFFPNTIRLWNSLPQHIVNKNSLDSFKSNIQTFHYSTF